MKTIHLSPLEKPVSKTVEIPTSKSYTNRALIIASLTKGDITIRNALISDDTLAMIDCLKKLGISIEKQNHKLIVNGDITDVPKTKRTLNAKLSGTTIRFLTALCAVTPGTTILTGDKRLSERPIGDLVNALKELGAKIEYLEKRGFPPITVSGTIINRKEVAINGTISSQFLSALLLVAPVSGIETIIVKDNLISQPYVSMTTDLMKHFGVLVKQRESTFFIPKKSKYIPVEYIVEGDYSSAAYFAAIAVLTKSTITITNLQLNSIQADKKFLMILKKMGNEIKFLTDKVTVTGKNVFPVSIDMESCPDQIQTLAVLAAFAKGKTTIKGISSLRIKETDRVYALQTELKKMGIKTKATKNILIIYGDKPKHATIETYGDHRMAMSFAVAGSVLNGMQIKNPDVVSKTFPEFWKKLQLLGIKITNSSEKNIVLIGMRGSGKSTIAKILADKLNRKCLELDAILEEKVGLPIAKIVEKQGWTYFREKESEIAKEVADIKNTILSTGGGIVTNEDNVIALKKNGTIVYLKSSITTLISRIGEDANRPFITKKRTMEEDLGELLKQRKPIYSSVADVVIDTDNISPDIVANEIIERLQL